MPFDYQAHFDWVALNDALPRRLQGYFRRQRLHLLRHHIPAGRRVIEWGCGRGDVLAGLEPGDGTGFDISGRMIDTAMREYPSASLKFRQGDLHDGNPAVGTDAIVLDDLCRYLRDVQACLEGLRASAIPETRLYITSLNYLWRPMLRLAQWLGMTVKHPECNWLSGRDIANLLELAGWEVISRSSEVLLPVRVPLLSGFCNRVLVRLPLFRHLGSVLFLVARPAGARSADGQAPTCSVVVPARNEAGNIRPALERIAVMGGGTEIIFVEGGSSDDTWATIQREIENYQGPLILKALRQPGIGKWDAVRNGMDVASGDILVVQDADLTAPPEDLPKFFQSLASGKAEFANGSRLVYPLERQAMRALNVLGNKFFALVLTFVVGQPLKDSLCGTKMLWRADYQRLLERIEEFGDFDPFGDFNLLFGAALLDLRIRDVPVRYKGRSYGDTNIRRFWHGLILLRMTWFGLRHLRFHR